MRSEQSQAGANCIDEAEDELEDVLTPLEGPEQLPALPEQPSSKPNELDLIGAFNQSSHSAMMVSGIDFVYSDEFMLDLHGALEQALNARSPSSESEPCTFKEAMKRCYWESWFQAAMAEMQAHISNGTWELVQLPSD